MAPTETDFWMMTLSLCELAYLLDEGERQTKVPEAEGAFKAMAIVYQFPQRHLSAEFLSFTASEWWDASTARHAGLLKERF